MAKACSELSWRRFAAYAALALLLSHCGGPSSLRSAHSAAPDFELQALDGRNLRLSAHRKNRVLLLNFWGVSCLPCLEEFPHLQALYEKYHTQGLEVLAVATDGPEQFSAVQREAARARLSFPVLLDQDTRVFAEYSSGAAIPLSVLLSRTGKVIFRKVGYQRGDERELEQQIVAALAAPTTEITRE